MCYMFNVASRAAILKCNISQETKSSTFHGPLLGFVRKSSEEAMLHSGMLGHIFYKL